ncbi:hypothetical protein ARMGADRAFT_1081158 [Armillaria gallica]|uniref:Uncharacterized protein n=1 Tax=Armillaria gallica TaxID=47427 RepID=A0A2H3DY19_ARMGA|nr:hypothetical protein ARMGADRAFT_1081158 [Armillaria gallica]
MPRPRRAPSDARSRTHHQQSDRDRHLHGPHHHLVADVLTSLPSADGYTIELVNISNINYMYAQTGTFFVSEPVGSSALASSTGSRGLRVRAVVRVRVVLRLRRLVPRPHESPSMSFSFAKRASRSASGSGSASASGSSTRALATTPSTYSAASTASTSAFNASSRA